MGFIALAEKECCTAGAFPAGDSVVWGFEGHFHGLTTKIKPRLSYFSCLAVICFAGMKQAFPSVAQGAHAPIQRKQTGLDAYASNFPAPVGQQVPVQAGLQAT